MLSMMRDKAGSWMIKILLGAIVVVFVFWGVGSFHDRQGESVASVNGNSISLEEYRNVYNNLMEQFKRSFGNRLNDETLKMLNIKQQALNQIIEKHLLMEEAKRLNFRVTNEELIRSIRSLSVFQKNGVFDPNLYSSLLSRNRLTPETFEASQRESILMEKLRFFILSSVRISDTELKQWHKWENTSIDIDYLLFKPESYKKIEITDKEIKEFFDKNSDNYQTEPKIKVQYLRFSPNDYKKDIEISHDEILRYFESHMDDFKIPKTVEARHILIKVDKDASVEKVEEKRKKAFDIFKIAKKDKDFGALAKKYSEGPSGKEGGLLGSFKKEEMVAPFSEKAFSMAAGEISEPLRTRFGWHIIKVEKVNEESNTPFDKAKTEIRKKLTDEKANTMAYDNADDAYLESMDVEDLLAISQANSSIKLLKTDFFTKKGPKKIVADPAQFALHAFELEDGEISEIKELKNEYYIIQMIDKKPERISDFEVVKKEVKAHLLKKKQDEKANDEAKRVLSQLKNGKSMKDAASKIKLKLKSTGFFKRNDTIPNIGYEREITDKGFKLSKKNSFTDDPIKGKKGYYIIRLKERKTSEPKSLTDKDIEGIKKKIQQQKEREVYMAFIEKLKSVSDIQIKEEIFN